MHQHQHPDEDLHLHEHGHEHNVHNDAVQSGVGVTLKNWLRWGKSQFGHQHGGHGHSHDTLASYANATERGIWAVKWSFVGMMVTAVIQVVIVVFTGSVALLADTIHNFTDAGVTIPLWVAFILARRRPSIRFTYGLGRVEDLAGVAIVLAILFSAIFVAYESVDRLLNPRDISFLWAVAAAAIIGFLGNEAVAMFRIKVGNEIGSAALIADGHHARVDGLTSLAVLFSAIGVGMGYPLADPVVGLIISVMILCIVWQSAKTVFVRLLDGVDPHVIDDIKHAASHVPGVQAVTEVRARWSGHRLHTEINLTADRRGDIESGHSIAMEARHQLLHHLPQLASVTIHVDPEHASGEERHLTTDHVHDNLPLHSHSNFL